MELFNFKKNKANITFIILGAGLSSRFEENKLLTNLDGKPMYQHIVTKAQKVKKRFKNIDNIIFVTKYFDIFYYLRTQKDVKCIMNSHPEKGISSSIQVGLAYAVKLNNKVEEGEIVDIEMRDNHYYMFFVADQPYLKRTSIEKFLKGFLKSEKGIGCMSYEGETGNPTIFKEKYISELLSIKGDIGGKAIVNKNIEDVFLFNVPKYELNDIDTKDDIKDKVYKMD